MNIIDKISESFETRQVDNTFQKLQQKNKNLWLIIIVLIALYLGLLYFVFKSNSSQSNTQIEIEKTIDSLRKENEILLFDISVNQEKVKQSEEKIILLEKNFQQSIGKLQQIQNQFLHEKNNPVPPDERPDAIRELSKQ